VRRARLLRVLGLGFGLAVTVGNTIGAGIFRAPGEIARQLPDPGLFLAVWAAGGVYALVGAIQIAELGTMLPRSGGQYVFCRHALGEYAGFVSGWTDWLATCGTTAAVAIAIAEFAGLLVPTAGRNAPAVAASLTAAVAIVQWRGIWLSSRVQNVTSLLKALAFGVLVAAAFAFGGGLSDQDARASSVAPAGLALAAAIVVALQAVIYTYDGWTAVVYFSEEVVAPEADIPRSLFLGVLSVAGIYLLVNLALVYALPITVLAGETFAAGALGEAMLGERGGAIFAALAIVSMLSAINAYPLMASRVLFAMSRDGLLSPRATLVNAGGTPVVALLLSAAAAISFIVLGQTFSTIITVLAFFFVANYALSFISVFVLRRREPARPRPYRAWGYPWTTGIALCGSVTFLLAAVAADTHHSLMALLMLAVSYPAFRVLRWSRTRPS
jgi:APA family basic amino acid/polyamine antiporter